MTTRGAGQLDASSSLNQNFRWQAGPRFSRAALFRWLLVVGFLVSWFLVFLGVSSPFSSAGQRRVSSHRSHARSCPVCFVVCSTFCGVQFETLQIGLPLIDDTQTKLQPTKQRNAPAQTDMRRAERRAPEREGRSAERRTCIIHFQTDIVGWAERGWAADGRKTEGAADFGTDGVSE